MVKVNLPILISVPFMISPQIHNIQSNSKFPNMSISGHAALPWLGRNSASNKSNLPDSASLGGPIRPSWPGIGQPCTLIFLISLDDLLLPCLTWLLVWRKNVNKNGTVPRLRLGFAYLPSRGLRLALKRPPWDPYDALHFKATFGTHSGPWNQKICSPQAVMKIFQLVHFLFTITTHLPFVSQNVFSWQRNDFKVIAYGNNTNFSLSLLHQGMVQMESNRECTCQPKMIPYAMKEVRMVSPWWRLKRLSKKCSIWKKGIIYWRRKYFKVFADGNKSF